MFGFDARSVRYVRFDMSECPQPSSTGEQFASCAIGEVAFGTVTSSGVVPEPGTYALVGTGLAALVAVGRRRARSTDD